MSKAILHLDRSQIIGLIENLSFRDKLLISRKLTQETWQVRFRNLISRIDSRIKRPQRISDREIVRIVKGVRARNYAQGHH